jgi:phospholipid/cholesterol/gamma-HCH transport system substrate-binding protein
MPRTRSLAWSELKIGILGLLAIVLAAALILAVGGQGGFFWEQYPLRTIFPNVQGLKAGAVVRVAGVEVGKVDAVAFVADGAGVEVLMSVNEDMQSRITTASRASIGSLSLLGEPIVEISASEEGTPLPPGALVPSAPSAGQISDVAATANRSLQEATALLQDVRKGQGTVGKLFTDDALYQEVRAFVDAAESVTQQISRGRGTLGALIQNPAAYRELEATLTNVNILTARLRAGEGSLGRLMADEAFARSLSATTGSLANLTARLERGEGTAGKLLTDNELYDRVRLLTGRFDTLVGQLQQGQGTVGQLLQDRQLYENMNAAVSELRSLVADIRKDPKRYLNVKVSIF